MPTESLGPPEIPSQCQARVFGEGVGGGQAKARANKRLASRFFAGRTLRGPAVGGYKIRTREHQTLWTTD